VYTCVQAVCELGRETINTPVYVQMDASECHVMTDNLARYTLTGEPRTPTSRAVKILRLAAFAPHLPTSVDFNLRVYFVEDTQDALEVCWSHRFAIYYCASDVLTVQNLEHSFLLLVTYFTVISGFPPHSVSL